MPRPSLQALTRPLQQFLHTEAAGGVVLMVATLAAMLLANSPLADGFQHLIEQPLRVGSGALALDKTLHHWINDALMVLFFVVVGLELKREMVTGHLSSWRSASLPAFAAAGGMLVPALIYALLNRGDALALRGWAIPTATDIAFALGVLSLLGNRVPPALKAFLLSIAIFDDLGAILIIALVYTDQLAWSALAVAAALIGVLLALNLWGVRRLAPYLVVGFALWLAVLKSGVHATLAGVMLAMFIPLREPPSSPAARAPLIRLQQGLHPWVAFGVLPVFALANAGVPLSGVAWTDLAHPVPMGIALGLLVGKPVGILAISWLAVRSRLCTVPSGVSWSQLGGMGLLCGIGFTMSLFVASLAFTAGSPVHAGLERAGILMGTLASGILGLLWLRALPAAAPGRAP